MTSMKDSIEDEPLFVGAEGSRSVTCRALTAEEGKRLRERLAAPAQKPTPEMQRAVFTYKCLMAQRKAVK